jgi:bifunctional dethiobiotin synthetase / adenosylmethionine---8-amino-7-oxononanoate aminotransferase
LFADCSKGYNSNAALGLQKQLLQGDGSGWNIHSRVLGNVLYVMASQISSPEKIGAVEQKLMAALQ